MMTMNNSFCSRNLFQGFLISEYKVSILQGASESEKSPQCCYRKETQKLDSWLILVVYLQVIQKVSGKSGRKKVIGNNFTGRSSGKFPRTTYGNIEKVVMFIRTECSKRKLVHFFKNHLCTNAERDSQTKFTVLKFAYHLPKP